MNVEQDFSVFVRHPSRGVAAMDLVVEGVHCGGCMTTIEKGLKSQRGVRSARVNLASKRVTVEWDDGAMKPGFIVQRLDELGFPAWPFAPEAAGGVRIQPCSPPCYAVRCWMRRIEQHFETERIKYSSAFFIAAVDLPLRPPHFHAALHKNSDSA